MKKIPPFLLLLLAIWTGHAQDTLPMNGYVTFRHDNGNVSSEGLLQDGQPEGWWKSYNEEGILISEGNRKNHLLDSLWIFYDDEGKKTLELSYKEGKKYGKRIRYSDDEYVVENWEADSIVGEVKAYDTNNVLKRTTPYENGKPHGFEKQFSADGTVTAIVRYVRGVMTQREYINRKDKTGQKQGKWKFFWDNGNLQLEGTYVNDKKHGFFKTYDENGNFLMVYKYENDVLIENAKETKVLQKKTAYHSNGKIAITATYFQGKPEGIRREYDTNGVLVRGYVFEDGILRYEGITDEKGQRQGLWKEYYPTGELRAKGHYKNSNMTGDWKFYLTDKTIEISGEYDSKGRKTGEWQWFYPGGELLAVDHYEDGLLEGDFVEYDENGEQLTRGQYISGMEEGDWFYRHGEKIEKGSFYEGQQIGTWRTWFANGKVASEVQYEQGLPDGYYRTYWENGNSKISGHYISGERAGIWHQYDQDGKLLLTTEYRDGFEIRWDNYKIEDE